MAISKDRCVKGYLLKAPSTAVLVFISTVTMMMHYADYACVVVFVFFIALSFLSHSVNMSLPVLFMTILSAVICDVHTSCLHGLTGS